MLGNWVYLLHLISLKLLKTPDFISLCSNNPKNKTVTYFSLWQKQSSSDQSWLSPALEWDCFCLLICMCINMHYCAALQICKITWWLWSLDPSSDFDSLPHALQRPAATRLPCSCCDINAFLQNSHAAMMWAHKISTSPSKSGGIFLPTEEMSRSWNSCPLCSAHQNNFQGLHSL